MPISQPSVAGIPLPVPPNVIPAIGAGGSVGSTITSAGFPAMDGSGERIKLASALATTSLQRLQVNAATTVWSLAASDVQAATSWFCNPYYDHLLDKLYVMVYSNAGSPKDYYIGTVNPLTGAVENVTPSFSFNDSTQPIYNTSGNIIDRPVIGSGDIRIISGNASNQNCVYMEINPTTGAISSRIHDIHFNGVFPGNTKYMTRDKNLTLTTSATDANYSTVRMLMNRGGHNKFVMMENLHFPQALTSTIYLTAWGEDIYWASDGAGAHSTFGSFGFNRASFDAYLHAIADKYGFPPAVEFQGTAY